MNIGLIAHDGKKKLMQNFCIAYRGILNKHELFATATTGRLIEEVTNLTIHKYLAFTFHNVSINSRSCHHLLNSNNIIYIPQCFY